jgi:hypothetical protein
VLFGGILINNSHTGIPYCELELSTIPCLRCGVCCSKFQPLIDLSEAHCICEKLALHWEDFLNDYIDPRWPGTQNLLIRQVSGACIFLKPSIDKKHLMCAIHDFKPSCCLEWKSGLDRAECQSVLLTKWGLEINTRGIIQGTEEQIKLFKEYLRSLPK